MQSGRSQPADYYNNTAPDKKSTGELFERILAGSIVDATRFKYEFRTAYGPIFAIKPQDSRYLCFRYQDKLVITNAFRKSTDKCPPEEKARSIATQAGYLAAVKEQADLLKQKNEKNNRKNGQNKR